MILHPPGPWITAKGFVLWNLTKPNKWCMIMYSKLYTEVVMRKDKNIMIRVSRETHTALKRKAAEEGTTMSRIIRELVGRYLTGELKVTESA